MNYKVSDYLCLAFNEIGEEVLCCYEKHKYIYLQERYVYCLYNDGSIWYFDQHLNKDEKMEGPIAEISMKIKYPLCYKGNSYVILPKFECLKFRRRLESIAEEYKKLI